MNEELQDKIFALFMATIAIALVMIALTALAMWCRWLAFALAAVIAGGAFVLLMAKPEDDE